MKTARRLESDLLDTKRNMNHAGQEVTTVEVWAEANRTKPIRRGKFSFAIIELKVVQNERREKVPLFVNR